MTCASLTRPCAFVCLLLLASGCVATSDLDRLNRDLSLKLESATAALTHDLATLHERVGQVQASQEDLRGDVTASVEGLRADTREALDKLTVDEQRTIQQLNGLDAQVAKTRQSLKEYVTHSSQALEQTAQMSRDLNAKLAAIEQSVAVVQGLPPAVGRLGTELGALRRTLQQTYKLEEAALKHRLRTLEELSRQLEPAPQQAKKSP